MIEKLVSKVPEHIRTEPGPQRGRARNLEFNVASWIRFQRAGGVLKLLVHYQDDEGEHVVTVDTLTAQGEGDALLSGVIRLRVTGRMKDMGVLLGLPHGETRWSVDELYVQQRGAAMAPANKLISGF